MGLPEIAAFLAHLVATANVAASTQNQAFSSLLFLDHHALEIDLGNLSKGRMLVPHQGQISKRSTDPTMPQGNRPDRSPPLPAIMDPCKTIPAS
jgi:hypothetical protein